jgi:hypothetical protein
LGKKVWRAELGEKWTNKFPNFTWIFTVSSNSHFVGNFEHVVKVVVSVVNFIRSHGLNYRPFQSFLSEIDAEYGGVSCHREVRWLSRGTVLKRFLALRLEIEMFTNEKGWSGWS